jgi:hypothetical protein
VPQIKILPDESEVLLLGDGEATAEVVDRLFALLFDQDETIRINAFASLVRLGGPATSLISDRLGDTRTTPEDWSILNGCGRSLYHPTVSDVAFAAIAAMQEPDADVLLAKAASERPGLARIRLVRLLGVVPVTNLSPRSLELIRLDSPGSGPLIFRAVQDAALAKIIYPALKDLAVARARKSLPDVDLVEVSGSEGYRQRWSELTLEQRAGLGLGLAGNRLEDFQESSDPLSGQRRNQLDDYLKQLVKEADFNVLEWRLAPLRALFSSGEAVRIDELLHHSDPAVRSMPLLLTARLNEDSKLPAGLGEALEANFRKLLLDESPRVRSSMWRIAAGSTAFPDSSSLGSTTKMVPEILPPVDEGARVRQEGTARRAKYNALFGEQLAQGLQDADADVRAAAIDSLPVLFPRLSAQLKIEVVGRLNAMQLAGGVDRGRASGALLTISREADATMASPTTDSLRSLVIGALEAGLKGDRAASRSLFDHLYAGRMSDASLANDEDVAVWLVLALDDHGYAPAPKGPYAERLRKAGEAARAKGRLTSAQLTSLRMLLPLVEPPPGEISADSEAFRTAAAGFEKDPTDRAAREAWLKLAKSLDLFALQDFLQAIEQSPRAARLLLTTVDAPADARLLAARAMKWDQLDLALSDLDPTDPVAAEIIREWDSSKPGDSAPSERLRSTLIKMLSGPVAENRLAAMLAWVGEQLPREPLRPYWAATLAGASNEEFDDLLAAMAKDGPRDGAVEAAMAAVDSFWNNTRGDPGAAERASIAVDALASVKADMDSVMIRAFRDDPTRIPVLTPKVPWWDEKTGPSTRFQSALEQYLAKGGRLPPRLVALLRGQQSVTAFPQTLSAYLERARDVPVSRTAFLLRERLQASVEGSIDSIYPVVRGGCAQSGGPSSSLPVFPWPPPAGFAVAPVPAAFFGRDPTLGVVIDRLRSALQAASPDFTYGLFETPGEGIVMVSRMERVRADGNPFPGRARWTKYGSPHSGMMDYLGDLFFERPGYFRVIVFAVTDDIKIRESPWARLPDVEEGADELTNKLRIQRLAPRRVVALVYSFKREPGKAMSGWRDGAPAPLNQLQRSGVWRRIAGSR